MSKSGYLLAKIEGDKVLFHESFSGYWRNYPSEASFTIYRKYMDVYQDAKSESDNKEPSDVFILELNNGELVKIEHHNHHSFAHARQTAKDKLTDVEKYLLNIK